MNNPTAAATLTDNWQLHIIYNILGSHVGVCCKLNLQIIGCRSGFPVHRQQQQQSILHSHKYSDALDVWQHKQTAGLSWAEDWAWAWATARAPVSAALHHAPQPPDKLNGNSYSVPKVRRPLPLAPIPRRAGVQESRLEMAQSTENGLVHIWTVMPLWVATWPRSRRSHKQSSDIWDLRQNVSPTVAASL